MKVREQDLKVFKNLIDSAKSVAILSPDTPDLDSVSSDLALAKGFQNAGKQVTILSVDPLPPQLSWMPPKELPFVQPPAKPAYDLVVMADFGGISQFRRLLDGRPQLIHETPTAVIDHHAMRDDYAGTVMLVDAHMAATGELLFHLFGALGWSIEPDVASWMLVGIIGDTGRFLHLNTSDHVLEVAAQLVRLGADSYKLNRSMIAAHAFTANELKALGNLLTTVQTRSPFAWRVVTRAELTATETDPGYVDQVMEHIRYLKDMRAMFVLGEQEDGTLRLTMRCEPEFDVSAVAKSLGGGGHKVAAGATVRGMTSDKAVEHILKALEEQRQ